MAKYSIIALAVLITISTHAQVSSTFNSNDEGWTATHFGGTVATTSYQNSGGNPGGRVSATPPTVGGTVNTSFGWYWNAPEKFFGKHDLSYQSTIQFDLQQSVAGTDNSLSDLIIEGSSGKSIHLRFTDKPSLAPAWTTYSIKLDETADWHHGSIGGVKARKYQIKEVLANITAIKIRCKYTNTPGYSNSIDNVILDKRQVTNGPTITSFSPTTGLPGESITITGTNFGATINDNIVRFGNITAQISSANATQIVVKVPSGATYSGISVINTTQGLVAHSALDFKPLMHDDPDYVGHIIPASFAPNVTIPYGDFNDNGLAGANLGDIDNDGLLDIVAFEDGQRKFAIFLNQGQVGSISNTSFSSKIEIPSGELGQGNSSGTLLADFDNDGKLDLATFSRGRDDDPIFDGGFAVSRNVSMPGSIQFEPAERFYRVTIFCSDLNATDLDGDGRLDFLITSGGLRVAQNISTPGKIDFTATRTISGSSGAISTRDLNDDGKPEIIVIASNSYEVHENISTPGNIQFAAPFSIPGSIVSGVTIADLDNDNKADLTFYRINGFNNYDLVVKKNIHTTGSLSAASFGPDVIVSKVNRAYSQRVYDLNGDAKPEILIAANSGSAGNGFTVFENVTADGILNTTSFLPGVTYEETATGVFAIPLIGDIDGDNKPDVIGFGSSDGSEHALILYHNESIAPPHIAVNTVSPLAAPIGTIVTITGEKFATTPSQNKVWFGAVEANVLTASKTILTVSVPAGATYDRVSVTRNNLTSRYHLPFNTTFSAGDNFDNNSFLPPVTYSLTGADYDVEVGDLDDDGKPEIIAESQVVTGIVRNYAFSFNNVHSSGPITTGSFIVTDSTNDSAYNLKILDIDEDGRLDITSRSAIFRNSSTAGNVNFDDDIGKATGDNQSWADLDLDGKTDLIAIGTGADVVIQRNHSMPRPFRTGTFSTLAAAISLPKPAVGGGTATGDFDNDGNAEFVASNPTTDNLRIWKNAGGFPLSAAQFTVVADIAAGDNPGRVYAGDLDVDGKLDLMLYHGTGTNSTIISVFHNQSTAGTISFTKVDFTIPNAATVAHISDLDGDGKPEILVTSESTGKFFILKNTSSPGSIDASSFATPFQTLVAGARGITTGDLNLDGKPEIIITATPSKLLVFENNIAVGPSITIDTQPTTTAVCEGDNATFTVDASGTTNLIYQWQFDSGTGFTNINESSSYTGTGTKTLTINTGVTGPAGAGEYRCKVSGDLATDVLTNDVQLNINSIPSAPVAAGATKCTSPATLTLTATGTSDGSYQWFDSPTGGSVLGTNGSFTTPPIATTTTYYVLIRDAFCGSDRIAVDATITLLAKPTINTSEPIANGGINLCTGEDCTLTAPSGFVTYTWSNGATSNEIIVAQDGTYSVVVEDGAGCVSPASDPIDVTVNPYPTAEITVNGTQLLSSVGDNYQWFENNEPISGATGQTFTFNLLEYGAYAVEVTDNGCTTRSDEYTYLITEHESVTESIKIYPNPFIDNINIENNHSGKQTVLIIDGLGKTVKRFSIFEKTTINLEDLAIGQYLLIIPQHDNQKRFRLMKVK